MMQGYLRGREQLTAVLQLVDSRHLPSTEDREMVKWLLGEQLPFCLVATKMDKLRQGERAPALLAIVRALELPAGQPMVPYSSHDGEGKKELLGWIGRVLAE
jgi:GTP-binding protein